MSEEALNPDSNSDDRKAETPSPSLNSAQYGSVSSPSSQNDASPQDTAPTTPNTDTNQDAESNAAPDGGSNFEPGDTANTTNEAPSQSSAAPDSTLSQSTESNGAPTTQSSSGWKPRLNRKSKFVTTTIDKASHQTPSSSSSQSNAQKSTITPPSTAPLEANHPPPANISKQDSREEKAATNDSSEAKADLANGSKKPAKEKKEEEKPKPKEEIVLNPVSSILFIKNLTRPFTLLQLKALLNEYGGIVEEKFWIDKLKSKCYVQYESEDQAIKAQEALHGLQWPRCSPKTLWVNFATTDELDYHLNLEFADKKDPVKNGVAPESDKGPTKGEEAASANGPRKYDIVLKKGNKEGAESETKGGGDREGRNADRERNKDRDRVRDRDRETDKRPIRDWDREKLRDDERRGDRKRIAPPVEGRRRRSRSRSRESPDRRHQDGKRRRTGKHEFFIKYLTNLKRYVADHCIFILQHYRR